MSKLAIAAVLLLLLAPAVVAQTADLVLHPFGSEPYATFQVLNVGPDIARDLVLTIDVPPELEVVRMPGHPRDVCDLSVRPIRCTRSTLATDEDMAVNLYIQAPPVDATYTLTATVGSGTLDPDPESNTGTVTYTTHLVTGFTTDFEPPFARVEPGAVQVIKVKVGNYARATPRDIRVKLESVNATIEAIAPSNPLFTCSLTSSTSALCTGDHLDSYCLCTGDIAVTLRASSDRNGGEGKLDVSTESNLPDVFPHVSTAIAQTYRMIGVTNTADAGPGSFRDAIEQANALCTPGPCKIAFEIPGPVPPEGWFTIIPATELPKITADRVFVDGTTQTRLTGDTNPLGPEIALDGYLALRGPEIYSRCEAVVQGLAIGHFFGGDGMIFSPGTCAEAGDRKEVLGNYIGVDPTGTRGRPNQRGLNLNDAPHPLVHHNVVSRNKWSGIWLWTGSARITDNRIEDNGKSGIVIGPGTAHAWVQQNVINRQVEMGVAVAPGAQLYVIRGNSMTGNGGLGIDINIDGVSPTDGDDEYPNPSNAPVLLSAVYDAARDRTVVTMLLRSRHLGPYSATTILDFYANASPDGEGEQRVVSYQSVFPGDGTPFPVELWGNLTGRWLNATATRTHSAWAKPPDDKRVASQGYTGEGHSTSELSNSVLVTSQ